MFLFIIGNISVPGSSSRCQVPTWLTSRHSWSSLDSEVSLHVNTGERSFRLRRKKEESHVTCRNIVQESENSVKIVNYVKSGCDSGFMCSVLTRKTSGVILARFGEKARVAGEACSDLYLTSSSDSVLLVSRTAGVTQSCPLSGRYQLSSSSPTSLLSCSTTATLVAGCGSSSLQVKSRCGDTQLSCHSHWRESGATRIILSVPDNPTQPYLCLSYTETTFQECDNLNTEMFNITETGPCLQALSSLSSAALITPGPALIIYLTLALILSQCDTVSNLI